METAPAQARTNTPRSWCRVRLAKWGGLVMSVLIATVFERSLRTELCVSHTRLDAGKSYGYYVDADRGAVTFQRAVFSKNIPQPGWHAFADRTMGGPLQWWPHWTRRKVSVELSVPFWLLFVLVGPPTLLLWYYDRPSARRRRAGLCVKCGYNLKGLAPGSVCPECGTRAAAGTRAGKAAADQRR